MKAGDYIILTTSLKLAKDILAVREGKTEGLAGTAEFKRLAGDMDLKGNQFHFMSSRLGKEFAKITKLAMTAAESQVKEEGPEEQKIFEMIKEFSGLDMENAAASGQLSVLRVSTEGIVMESHSSGDALGAAPLVVIGVTGIAASVMLPALAKAKAKANALKSASNVGQLCKGLIFHGDDNDDKLPPANQWCDAILREVGTEQVFMSPQDPTIWDDAPGKRSSYALNAAVAGKNLNELAQDTVLVFECPVGWNGTGGLKEALEFLEFFDGHAIAVGTAEGAVRQVSSPDQLRRMRWEP
jgi:hypothetical protein